MRYRNSLILFPFFLLASVSGWGQKPVEALIGLKTGVALATKSPSSESTVISPSLTAVAGVNFSELPIALYSGLGYEQHGNPVPYAPGRVHYLKVPVYLRLFKPNTAVHLSLGTAYAWALNQPSTDNIPYQTIYYNSKYQREWSFLFEVECRLKRTAHHEFTVALSNRYALDPTLATTHPRYFASKVYNRFLALTFNAYLSTGH
ncbi:hypothetical protein [Hymenobacter daeguensis]